MMESVGVILVISVAVVMFLIQIASGRGKELAKAYAGGNYPIMEVALKNEGNFVRCFVADAKDGIWFVEIDFKSKKRVRSSYVSRDKILPMSTWSAPVDSGAHQKSNGVSVE